MTRPREYVGCVVGVRSVVAAGFLGTHYGSATVRRAWRRKSDGALTRVVLVWGESPERMTEWRYRVRSVERHAGAVPERVLVLGGTW